MREGPNARKKLVCERPTTKLAESQDFDKKQLPFN